ncbi:MAG: T9SS type A sorting domain-containing protein [Gemmatimonadetes bacterium]|nr:T9SS type A sorting domain-containing protein [Gemmatimonadota bacterium]
MDPCTFDALNSLTWLLLSNNALTTLEPSIFDGLSSLTFLELQNNQVDPLPITISLERVGEDSFQVKAHTGAPFAILLPVQITNGSLLGEASHITIPTGRRTSDTLTVAHTAGTSDAVIVDIGPLPQLPPDHNGYTLVKSADLPLHLSVVATSVEVSTSAIPTTSGLDPNFPNPFNASTQIAYRLATSGLVRLEIYNVLGQPVRTLVNQFQPAGFYQVPWDARDQRGAPLAAGVYLARLRHPDGVQTRRLLYLK